MIKSLVHNYLKAALTELFTDTSKENVKLSLGGDLFAKSELSLKNLSIRPDIFDIYLYPLRLVSGNVGKLHITGIAEAIVGGQLNVHMEDMFLLFVVDKNADVLQIQLMKKILIELMSKNISQAIFRDILVRLQGVNMTVGKGVRKKRDMLLRMMNYIAKKVTITVKTVHWRLETRSDKPNAVGKLEFSSIGFTLPVLRFYPTNSTNAGMYMLAGFLVVGALLTLSFPSELVNR